MLLAQVLYGNHEFVCDSTLSPIHIYDNIYNVSDYSEYVGHFQMCAPMMLNTVQAMANVSGMWLVLMHHANVMSLTMELYVSTEEVNQLKYTEYVYVIVKEKIYYEQPCDSRVGGGGGGGGLFYPLYI